MRIESGKTVDSRYTFSIILPVLLYQKLLNKAGRGRVSTFVREVLEKELIGEEQKREEQLRQQLIEAYRKEAKSKATDEEMAIWEGVAGDSIND